MEIKLKNLKIGEQFILNGNTYTKLNKQGYCLLDEYNASVPDWVKFMAFDAKEDYYNDFEKSTIKDYINSKFFKNAILDVADYLKPNTEITLLSAEEMEEYKEQIKEFFAISWLRTPSPNYPVRAYCLNPSGVYTSYNLVLNSRAVRPVLYLNLQSAVSRVTEYISDGVIKKLQAQLGEIQEKLNKIREE